jgi:hypothetical protein
MENNEKREEGLSLKNYNVNTDKFKEHFDSLKYQTREFIINSPFLLKAQDSSKDFLKNYFFNPITNVYNTKVPELRNAVFNNKFVNIPMNIIERSNYKNLIQLKLNNNRVYNITHTDRKLSVVVLTVTGTILHYLTSKKNSFKFKWLIPYYVFFSLLLCRENLDPYGS